MSDLKEVLEENSYLRQKQLIFADCDRYQRARVSTLLSNRRRRSRRGLRCPGPHLR